MASGVFRCRVAGPVRSRELWEGRGGLCESPFFPHILRWCPLLITEGITAQWLSLSVSVCVCVRVVCHMDLLFSAISMLRENNSS